MRRITLLIFFIGGVMVAAWFAARHLLGPDVRRAHTGFLLAQFDQSYSDFLRGGNDPAASEQSFRELIATWTIDWNSCEFRNGTAFDSWGTAIEIRTDAPAIHLRSAGPDRRFGTSDDIARQIGRGPAA